jgi:spore germination protein
VRRWTSWIFGGLALVFAVWGITQYMAKERLSTLVENGYQRAFYELTYNIESLETLLAQASASNDPKQQMNYFSDTWRQASAAQANLGQLPLSNLELANTEKFISQLEAFSFSTFRRIGEGQTLDEKAWNSLQGFFRQAKHIRESLDKMQPHFQKGPDWQGVQRATMAQVVRAQDSKKRPSEEGALESNPIVKSFMMMEDGLKRYPDPDFEGNMLNFRARPRGFTGPQISRQQAVNIARKFMAPNKRNQTARVVGTEKGDVPAFHVEIVPTRQENRRGAKAWRTMMSISQKGGHLIWMLTERNIGKPTISVTQARARGLKYLKDLGYEGMESLAADPFDGVVNCSYVRKIGDVWIYPEEIKLQIALDNGEILGFEAMNFLTFKGAASAPAYPLTEAQARARVNKRLKIERVRKAVILDDRFRMVATYEFKASLNKEKFLVYINAATGDEVKLIREVPGQTEII